MKPFSRTARALLATPPVLAAVLFSLAVPAAPRAQAASRSVTMSGYAFGPATLTIDAGDTVTWSNRDTAPHDVKTTSGPVALHSPMLAKGGTWAYTFSVPGTYHYYCTVHPDMLATLVVRAAPTTAPAAAPTSPPVRHRTHGPSPAVRPSSAEAAASHHASHESGKPSAHTSPPPPAAAAMPTPASAVPTPVQIAARPEADSRPLRPLLLLTGLVSGVAVLCLLLVGSRSHPHSGG